MVSASPNPDVASKLESRVDAYEICSYSTCVYWNCTYNTTHIHIVLHCYISLIALDLSKHIQLKAAVANTFAPPPLIRPPVPFWSFFITLMYNLSEQSSKIYLFIRLVATLIASIWAMSQTVSAICGRNFSVAIRHHACIYPWNVMVMWIAGMKVMKQIARVCHYLCTNAKQPFDLLAFRQCFRLWNIVSRTPLLPYMSLPPTNTKK